MATITSISSSQLQTPAVQEEGVVVPEEKTLKKTILIALPVFFTIGMFVSYVLAAPWLVTLGLFALALAPLFSLGKIEDDHKDRIQE